jgi:hypothetical protein
MPGPPQPAPYPLQPAPYPPPPPPPESYPAWGGPPGQPIPYYGRSSEPEPGWFAGLEIGIDGVHIKNHITGTVFFTPIAIPDFALPRQPVVELPPIMATIFLPVAELDVAGAPKIDLGYRFADHFGEVILSYRAIYSEGRASSPEFVFVGDDGFLRSRLEINVVDLDYASWQFAVGNSWDMKWRVGVRFANVFFDSDAFNDFLAQRVSNNFWGVGPHVGLELWRHFRDPGLAFYTKAETAALIGQVRQHFSEAFPIETGFIDSVTNTVSGDQVVPVVKFQAGLSWEPAFGCHRLRFTGGYEIESWWDVGRAGGSNADILVQGGFLRAEWNF